MKIKQCPFCGSTDLLIVDNYDVEDREGFPARIACDNCGTSGPCSYIHKNHVDDMEYIAEKSGWNNRVKESE